MIEYKEEKKRIFFMGSELVSFCVRYPEIEGKEKINSFVLGLVSNSILWVTDELFAAAREEYERGARGDKYFTYKPYRYTLSLLADEREEDIFLRLEALLCRAREKAVKYDAELVFDSALEIIKKPRKEKNGA